jgi:hypothetical protein
MGQACACRLVRIAVIAACGGFFKVSAADLFVSGQTNLPNVLLWLSRLRLQHLAASF